MHNYKYFSKHTLLPASPLFQYLLWQENLVFLTDDEATEMDALIDSSVQASIFPDKHCHCTISWQRASWCGKRLQWGNQWGWNFSWAPWKSIHGKHVFPSLLPPSSHIPIATQTYFLCKVLYIWWNAIPRAPGSSIIFLPCLFLCDLLQVTGLLCPVCKMGIRIVFVYLIELQRGGQRKCSV